MTRAAFAVNSIRQWWQAVGRARLSRRHPIADHCRWGRQQRLAGAAVKRELQKLATNSTSISWSAICLPAPASGNKIEHRLFSFISQNWRASARQLPGHRRIDLGDTTKTGLTVRCELDTANTQGIVVSDPRWPPSTSTRRVPREWNYTISPNTHPPNHALIS